MQKFSAIVFDLYGTVYDVHSVRELCEASYPTYGDAISRLWRQKQLEYTWLRSLMGRYADFENVTEDALRFTCRQLDLALDAPTHRRLCEGYLHLDPHPEATAALRRLKEAGLPTAILSNGSQRSIEQVVGNAGMQWAFDALISVEDVRVFKPDNRVYALAEQRMGHRREDMLFVSSNAWDASGALHFGFPVCWINRQGGAFDELGVQPTHTCKDLAAMLDWVLSRSAQP